MSYDSRWAIDFQPHNKNYDQLEVLLDYYRPLREQGLTVDIVSADAPLDSYKFVFAPSLNVIPPQTRRRICSPMSIRAATCVLGPRSGMKDEHNSLNVERQPGPLVAPLGGRVEQYYALDSDGAGERSRSALEPLHCGRNSFPRVLQTPKFFFAMENQQAGLMTSPR